MSSGSITRALQLSPFPMFSDASLPMFSVELSAAYLPLPNCVNYGPALIGEIPLSETLIFEALYSHETVGHKMTSDLLANTRIRLEAAAAYDALWEIMVGGGREAWQRLQGHNLAIRSLEAQSAFLDELCSTFFGMRPLREQGHPTPLAEREELQRELVLGQSSSHTFGDNFSTLYQLMDSALEKVGYKTLHLLTYYAEDVRSIDSSSGKFIEFDIDQALTIPRLHEALIQLHSKPSPLETQYFPI
jgi:hypothetical protein